jgi:DNA helicase-2/ATP-dependent DNA helicase PcrA
MNLDGFNTSFTVYDEVDASDLIRAILRELKIHEALYRNVLDKISLLKNAMIGPGEFVSREDGFGFEEKLARIYVRYKDELARNNALDYDDLVLFTIKLLETDSAILEEYNNRYSNIMVDDFHDATFAQYQLLKLLSKKHKNICVAGDEFQITNKSNGYLSENLFSIFTKDFPDAKYYILDENFRSTQHIVGAAHDVLGNERNNGEIRPQICRQEGKKVCCCMTNTDKEESCYIAKMIKEFFLTGKYRFQDCVVFFRVGQQCKALEESLKIEGLPYRIEDSTNLYQKKEIKDAVAYVKIVANPSDAVSLKRVMSSQNRGINLSTINKLEHEMVKRDITFLEAMRQYVQNSSQNSSTSVKLRELLEEIDTLMTLQLSDASEILKWVLRKPDFLDSADEIMARMIHELFDMAKGKGVHDFIDLITLYFPLSEGKPYDVVTLMPLFNARGYEYPVVFIPGFEDGLIPHFNAFKSDDILQEERKLVYIGMTRAKDVLVLTGARKRKLFTSLQVQKPSRFIKYLSQEYCQFIEKKPKIEPLSVTLNSSRAFHSDIPLTNGARVKHPTWGIGVVRNCYGDKNDTKVMVNFSSVGIKKLSLKFANLEML